MTEYDVDCCSKIIELEEELKVVSNNMKSLEIAEQEVRLKLGFHSNAIACVACVA